MSEGQRDDYKNLCFTYNFITHVNPPLIAAHISQIVSPIFIFHFNKFAHWSRGPIIRSIRQNISFILLVLIFLIPYHTFPYLMLECENFPLIPEICYEKLPRDFSSFHRKEDLAQI